MALMSRVRQVGRELREHAPFTVFGALTGIVFMVVFRKLTEVQAEVMFGIFHPLHVGLSAMVTAALYKLRSRLNNFFVILVIGWVGSIGIATLSDSIIPFFGESILGVAVPTHMDVFHAPEAGHEAHEPEGHDEHEHTAAEHQGEHGHECTHEHGHEHGHGHRLHLGFIEHWYIVNPAAVLGVIVGYFWPHTRFPHASHVLISTWASTSHILMNLAAPVTAVILSGIFIVLFIAVWVPCCLSDIVFPILLVRPEFAGESCGCHHGHEHEH